MTATITYGSSISAVVDPWPLFACQLVDSPYHDMAYSWPKKFVRIYFSGNTAEPERAYLLPTSFVTAQLLALDVTDDDALVGLCDAYGPLVSPFAGAYDRMLARLSRPDFDGEIYARRASSYEPKPGFLGSLMGRFGDRRDRPSEVNPVIVGMDLWYEGLHASAENTVLYESGLGPLRAFGHQDSSVASDVVAMVRASEGVAAHEALVSVEDVRRTAALLQVGCSLLIALDRYGGDYARAYESAIERRTNVKKAYRLLGGLGTLGGDDGSDVWEQAKRNRTKAEVENLLDWIRPFMDACLTRNGGNRSIIFTSELRLGRFAEPQKPVGSLAQAIVAQLLEYLADGNGWKECAVCGLPFKYEQRKVGPILSEGAAVKEATKAHRTTKARFCSKRHETQWSRAEQAKIRARRAPKKA